MKKKSTSRSAPARRPAREYVRSRLGEGGFFNLRVLVAAAFCLTGIFIALGGMGLSLGTPKAEAQLVTANSPNGPELVPLVGPVCVNTDLRDLPYIPPVPQILRHPVTRYARAKTGGPRIEPSGLAQLSALITEILRPVPMMPPPLSTFEGISYFEGGEQIPPDTNGDVGPNHYVQSVNLAFKVFDKNGNTLSGPTTFNSFFAPLGTSTPCGLSQQKIDQFVFYDQMADRWVVTVHAQDWDATTFWECIGV